MLSSASDGLQIRSRLHFSQSSQPSSSQMLNNAFKDCQLQDSSQQTQQNQTMQQTQPTQLGSGGSDVSMTQTQSRTTQSLGSQAYGLGSQDFSTPADQQFETEPATGGKKLRSPGKMTPKRLKRQRVTLSAGSQGSQGPPGFHQNQKIARDLRHSPRCTHNSFVDQAEPDGVKVARRLPFVTNMYRDVFKELRTLGQGNFSKVFHVRNRMDGLEYAVKRSKQEIYEEALKRQWFQEIQALGAAGTHPNVVRYYSSWVEEKGNGGVQFYIQLEKCGASLGQRFSVDRRPLREGALTDILHQLTAALQHLHGQGIAHMDVKPDNIYLTEDNVYKLGDFGLATSLKGKQDVEVEEGDCKYLPSEVLNGDYSRLDKADMFALGATLYQLATGSDLPEGGEAYTNLRQGKLKLLPGYSNAFQSMLKQLMSKDPAERPSPKKVLAERLLSKTPAYKLLDLKPAGT